MPYKRHPRATGEDLVAITVRLPESLIRECQLLGTDPNGRIRFGFWTKLLEWGCREWLKTQKVSPP